MSAMMQRKKQVEELVERIQVLKRRMFTMDCAIKNKHITASQWLVIRHLRKSEGVTLKALARDLGMSSSAITQLVTPLVHKGYVTKRINASDKREAQLVLAAKSIKYLEAFRVQHALEMGDVFKVLTDEEFSLFCRLSEKITTSTLSKDRHTV